MTDTLTPITGVDGSRTNIPVSVEDLQRFMALVGQERATMTLRALDGQRWQLTIAECSAGSRCCCDAVAKLLP